MSKVSKSQRTKVQSRSQLFNLIIISGVFSIIDHARGYVSTAHELWKNTKEEGLRLPKAEVPERRIAIGLKRTRVSGLSTPIKRKGRMKES
jgi:hypothetical protein